MFKLRIPTEVILAWNTTFDKLNAWLRFSKSGLYPERFITTRVARVILFSVVSVCVSVCQHDNSWTVSDIGLITKFSWHHPPMIERADKFENGYTAVRGWWFDVADLLAASTLLCPVAWEGSLSMSCPYVQYLSRWCVVDPDFSFRGEFSFKETTMKNTQTCICQRNTYFTPRSTSLKQRILHSAVEETKLDTWNVSFCAA